MKNTKEQSEEPKLRYRVGISMPERVVFYILDITIVVIGGMCGVDCARQEGFEKAGWIFLITLVAALAFWISINSHIAVYKGRVVINKILWKKEYPLSAFGEPKKDTELIYTTRYQSVEIHVYHDRNGKKLFKVRSAWENSDKFYKEIKQHYRQIGNSQKAKNV